MKRVTVLLGHNQRKVVVDKLKLISSTPKLNRWGDSKGFEIRLANDIDVTAPQFNINIEDMNVIITFICDMLLTEDDMIEYALNNTNKHLKSSIDKMLLKIEGYNKLLFEIIK